MEQLLQSLPALGTATGVALALFGLHRLLQRTGPAASRNLRLQVGMIGATMFGGLILVLVLPITEVMRGQILSFIGLVLSAAIALSSTTFLGNALAGVMLRSEKSFRMGDFIRVEGHFGRVSERGLFHVEIQNEESELTTLPNLYLVNHPFTTLRSSGTVLSCDVSLGYDVPRGKVKDLMLEAAQETGLEDPFIQIGELGDYSVTYRVAGILKDLKHLVSTRSRLRGRVIDALHRGRIEIVSPSFMNTRAVSVSRPIIPLRTREAGLEETAITPEQVLFEKAEHAQSLETLHETRERLTKDVAERLEQVKSLIDGGPKERLQAEIERIKKRQKTVNRLIAVRESRFG